MTNKIVVSCCIFRVEISMINLRLSIQLAPFLELFEPQPGQCIQVWPAGFFVSSRQSIVFIDKFRQPFSNSKAFVFAVGNRLQESRSDVLPIMLRDPASLRSKDTLQNHRTMPCIQDRKNVV